MLLFSKTEVSERIKSMQQYEYFEGELSDEEWIRVYGDKTVISEGIIIDENMSSDSTTALQALGYKKKDAERYMMGAVNAGAKTVEDVIKFALKAAQQEKNFSGT
jgi:hypothetical protein